MSFEPNIERARFNMIEQQIRPWDVLDPAVLELLATVRREDFVPPAYRALAFVDTEVPLPVADGAREFMLAPKVEARLLQELSVARHETVLEIGAGSGFMAALLAHKGRQVISLEIQPRTRADGRGQPGPRRCPWRYRAPPGRRRRAARRGPVRRDPALGIGGRGAASAAGPAQGRRPARRRSSASYR